MLKDFDQSQELKTIDKKSLQFYMFPTSDFFVIQTETRFCYMEDGWKVGMNLCTALWSFVNFCCLSQSEVSTDNRKVSTFFYIPTCSLPLLLSLLSGPFLNKTTKFVLVCKTIETIWKLATKT